MSGDGEPIGLAEFGERTEGNGQLTLADVVGTVFSPAFPGGFAPRTHTLVAVASLPKIAGTPDPSSNFGVTPTIHGCSIYRYSATNLPGASALTMPPKSVQ